jgi:prolyl-tRNA editing enzyme YbaK/EbsC (Cys-tRNA(Pro) deacylase)
VSADPAVIAALDGAGVDYEVLPCDPALADTTAFCAAYGIPPEQSANAILVASRRPAGKHAVCAVLATTRLDVNRVVRDRLGVKKVSFAPPDETTAVTGMAIGGVTVLALPDGLPVWVDARVLIPDWVVVGAGTRSAKIRIAPGDLVRAARADVVEGLATPAG